jgi:pSer/pThr/pTyr-binding forkhead associated (FHA) protein/soluble lytic murein transglycosylase-like protein
MSSASSPRAWLVLRSGSAAATRFPIRAAVTRIGRDAGNDLIVEGPGSEAVSGRHFEIRVDHGGYRLIDLRSRNGTFVNGERVEDARLASPAVIHLGEGGLAIGFELDSDLPLPVERTVRLSRAAGMPVPQPTSAPSRSAKATGQDAMVSAAVQAARQARRQGLSDQTGAIMRQMLGTAMRRSSRKFKATIVVLIAALLTLSGAAYWRIRQLETERRDAERHIHELDELLEAGSQDPGELDRLAVQIEAYQQRAQAVQDNILYRLGRLGRHEAFVQAEIKTLMKDFGAEVYTVPPEFVDQVNRFLADLQARERDNVARLLGRDRADLDVMRGIFAEMKLPPDLVFIALIESALRRDSTSPAGAVGPWQFTAPTARAYGLQVGNGADERTDLRKSTAAAGRYIRDLILEFGAGSSVMLALAAYNVGPGRVKRAIQRVEDPIKQRNFWYLYRVRALPAETRQYVPKIVAAIIVGRHPDRFGF